MSQKYLKYNHPASSKYIVNKVYSLEELKQELSLEKIKVLFEPINFKWEDLEVKKYKRKVENEETEE